MNKKFKKIGIICLILIGIPVFLIGCYFFIIPYFEVPEIKLVGEANVKVNVGGKYEELGASAILDSEDVSDKIKVDGEVDLEKVGDYTLTYSITNSKGFEKREVQRVVEVRDLIKPTLKLKGKSTYSVNYNSKYVDPGYFATDNYDGNLTKKVTVTGEVNTKKFGTYKLVYSVTDSSGNKVSTTRKVKVIDSQSPVITLSGKNRINIELNSSYDEPGYGAMDNYDGDLTDNVYVKGKINTKVPGVYYLYYNVSDSFGNFTSIKRTIQVGSQSDIDAFNYVKVSIEDQKLWYYKNGKLELTSNVVTGYKGKHDTKTGRFRVRNLARGTYLIGRDYKSWVDYWMLFDSSAQLGFHDATWRSSFGGNIYTYDGSHGCVNMPYSKAKQLFSNLTVGTLVIIS